MPEIPAPVRTWLAIAESRDPDELAQRLAEELLAEEVVFRSPAVHAPQVGRELTTAYLAAAIAVLGPSLGYRRRWYAEDSAVLEFEAELDGRTVHGIDLLQWNAEGRVTEFTVMVRPLRGLEKLIEQMAAKLLG